jgi:hypothetical protein
MPADFSDYVDMIPEDVSPGQIYLGAVELARLTLPEFKIRQGTPEDALLQAAAYMNYMSVAQINRLPPRLMEGIGRIMGVTKQEGGRSTIEITITLNQNTGIAISSGTVFLYEISIEGVTEQFAYETTADIAADTGWAGTPSAITATLTSRAVGVHPVIASGADMILQNIMFEVDTVVSTGNFTNGSNGENPLDYLTRTTTYLRGLSSALAKASQVKSNILSEYNIVQRSKVYDLTNGTGTYPRLFSHADDLGFVAIYAYGNNRQLTATEKADIELSSANKSIAGLTFSALDMELLDVEVTATLKYDDTYGSVAITALVRDAILNHLSPLGFTGTSEGWTTSDVASVIQRVNGVLYVDSVSFSVPAGNSNTGNAYSTLFQISGGNVSFLAKGCLPKVTTANLTTTLTAVTVG